MAYIARETMCKKILFARVIDVKYLIVVVVSPYNIILGPSNQLHQSDHIHDVPNLEIFASWWENQHDLRGSTSDSRVLSNKSRDSHKRPHIGWCPPFWSSKYWLRLLGSQIGSRSIKAHSHEWLEGGPNRFSRPSGDEDRYIYVYRQRYVYFYLQRKISTFMSIEEAESCPGNEGHHRWRGGKTIWHRVYHKNKVSHLVS